ncbi:MAG: Na+/H+ antiporter subunit E [Hyphomicrobiaceae bacterium]
MIASTFANLSVRRVATPLIGYASLWYALAGADVAAWVVGVPTVLAAVAVGLACRGPPWRLSPRGAARFAAIFLAESLKGGLDVAARVLSPRVRIAPALVDYQASLLGKTPARAFFVLCVSLLPGTLVASIEDDRLVIHALDAGEQVPQDLMRLERAVADLFQLDAASADARNA